MLCKLETVFDESSELLIFLSVAYSFFSFLFVDCLESNLPREVDLE